MTVDTFGHVANIIIIIACAMRLCAVCHLSNITTIWKYGCFIFSSLFYIEQNVYVFDWYGMLAVQLEYLPDIWRFTMWLNWRNKNCWHARWLLWFWLDARWNWQEHRKQTKTIDCSVHTHCIQNFVRCGVCSIVGVCMFILNFLLFFCVHINFHWMSFEWQQQ